MKLDNYLIIRDNHLIGIGESFIVINIIEKNEEVSNLSQLNHSNILNTTKTSYLKIKVFGSSNNGETL
jgi:hypothetical protein